MPQEEPGKVRARLADDLRPAATLRIALVGERVDITRDSEPVREFLPGQSVSRIDTSGAASIVSGWDQSAFVIRARYTNKAARSWRLEHDPSSDTLRVTLRPMTPISAACCCTRSIGAHLDAAFARAGAL